MKPLAAFLPIMLATCTYTWGGPARAADAAERWQTFELGPVQALMAVFWPFVITAVVFHVLHRRKR